MRLHYTILVALPIEQDTSADDRETAMRYVLHDPAGLGGAREAVGAWLRRGLSDLRHELTSAHVGEPEAVMVCGDVGAALRAFSGLPRVAAAVLDGDQVAAREAIEGVLHGR